MKTKEELQKYIREEVSNPIIGQMIVDMREQGVPYDDIMGMVKILTDNLSNVETKLVEQQLRIEGGNDILSQIKW